VIEDPADRAGPSSVLTLRHMDPVAGGKLGNVAPAHD
jgi:hypothetical protein